MESIWGKRYLLKCDINLFAKGDVFVIWHKKKLSMLWRCCSLVPTETR
nr:MAG TPA: hypothetical protein [Caudoviricetes sp.]